MISLLAQVTAGGNETYLFWGIILLIASILLLSLELFVPSGGLIGLLAGVSAIGSVIAFFQYDATWGLVATAIYLVLGPIVGIFGFRWWLNSPLGRGMILGGGEEEDLDEEMAISDLHARQERLAQLRQLIGAQGVTVTPLRPVGFVKINGQRIDALSDSGIIEAGVPVIVTDVYDNQIKVRAAV